MTDPLSVPWATDFEHGFCDLYVALGYCYTADIASFEVVDTLGHSGTHSVAFNLQTQPDLDPPKGAQARCVREGVLPVDAYYGAWYFIPEAHSDIDNWNLLHFQGGTPGGNLPNLWDVSIETDEPSGNLRLYALGSARFGNTPNSRLTQDDPATTLPIGRWFHVEFRFRRASDATGRISVFQDEKLILDRENLVTDDTEWGQWYWGSLANKLTPPESTLYVDDISIRPAP